MPNKNKSAKNALYVIPQRRNNTPSLSYSSYTDFQTNVSASTTLTTFSLLDAIQAILSTYPQHAQPVRSVSGAGNRLRQRLLISRIEMRANVTGSQSNILAAGDLTNFCRLAVLLTGPSYTRPYVQYLTSVLDHGQLFDISKVYYDRTISLPSQAFDSNTNYNVPQVISVVKYFNIQQILDFYSLDASGTNWETEKLDLNYEVVSDSNVAPHPTVNCAFRIFFRFLQG